MGESTRTAAAWQRTISCGASLARTSGFGAQLAEVSDELEHGRGLVLLRGLPVKRYSADELRQLYWGIGTHLGVARYQNATAS